VNIIYSRFVKSKHTQYITVHCFTKCSVVAWPSCNVIGHINEATLRWACMVLRKVTIRGHPLGSTLTETGNKYGPKDSSLQPER